MMRDTKTTTNKSSKCPRVRLSRFGFCVVSFWTRRLADKHTLGYFDLGSRRTFTRTTMQVRFHTSTLALQDANIRR